MSRRVLVLGAGAGRRVWMGARVPAVELNRRWCAPAHDDREGRLPVRRDWAPVRPACTRVAVRYGVQRVTLGRAPQRPVPGRVEVQRRGAYAQGRTDTRSGSSVRLPELEAARYPWVASEQVTGVSAVRL